VQPFIAQARKTRDLWVGSLLLSKLMEAAMDGIQGEFIFPGTEKVEGTPDIPNKYVAIFDDLSQAQSAAVQSKQQIARRWQHICDAVWKEMIAPYGDEETRRIWKRQTGVDPDTLQTDVDILFETYWVIVARKEGQAYGDWFSEVEGTLAARKRLRDFKAEEEPGEKSAISGEREILHRSEASPRQIQDFWRRVAAYHSQMDIDLEGKEHLDAIDTIKRFAMEAKAITTEKPFPSTSSIATASFVERLMEAAIDPPRVLEDWHQITGGKLVDKAPEATRDIPYLEQKSNDPNCAERAWILRRDGDLYFPETFVPRRLVEDYRISSTSEAENRAKRGRDALRALLQATDALNITHPTPYYAVVQMDGDNMGILLSGVHNDREHSNISKALSSFSRKTALDLVEKQYPARLVYAGGDDALAFAPLARDAGEVGQPGNVFELVDRLQRKYRQEVTAMLPAPQSEKRVKDVTASSGVVIAHHYTSLSYVLRSAREAESLAKQRYGRNALVVTLIRRSGEQTRVGCHWHYQQLGSDEDSGQPIALFSRFYQLFKHDVLSPKCVYTLLEEAPALVKLEIEEAQDKEQSASAVQSEIKRVLKRQRDARREADFTDTEVNQYAWYLARLAAAMDADEYPHLRNGELKAVELYSDSRRYGLVEVLGWLLVMAFLARKEQE
jgi:CRISPR-associated protein Cmr2